MKILINDTSLGIKPSKALHHLKVKDHPNPCNMELRMAMKRLHKSKEFRKYQFSFFKCFYCCPCKYVSFSFLGSVKVVIMNVTMVLQVSTFIHMLNRKYHISSYFIHKLAISSNIFFSLKFLAISSKILPLMLQGLGVGLMDNKTLLARYLS